MYSILPPIPVSNLIWCLISVDFRLIWMIRNQYVPVQSTPRCKVSPSKYQKATTLQRWRIPLVSHTICLSFPTLVAWSRFDNSWGLTDSKTYKRVCWNVSHVVGGFLWRACGPRGVTLFNHMQLATPLLPAGPPSDFIWSNAATFAEKIWIWAFVCTTLISP